MEIFSLLLKTGDQSCSASCFSQTLCVYTEQTALWMSADFRCYLNDPLAPVWLFFSIIFGEGESGELHNAGKPAAFHLSYHMQHCTGPFFSPLNVFNSWVSKVVRKYFWKANCMQRNAEVFPCFHLCNIVFHSLAKCFDISSGLENLWG